MKICYSCKQSKPLEEFARDKNSNSGRQSRCKQCAKEAYQSNKDSVRPELRKRARHSRERLQALAADRMKSGCVDCGEKNILVLEFDHKDPLQKDETIGVAMQKARKESRFIEEMDKCEVRCSNCHSIKTAHENNSWRLRYLGVI